jgi:hypothetical protein
LCSGSGGGLGLGAGEISRESSNAAAQIVSAHVRSAVMCLNCYKQPALQFERVRCRCLVFSARLRRRHGGG